MDFMCFTLINAFPFFGVLFFPVVCWTAYDTRWEDKLKFEIGRGFWKLSKLEFHILLKMITFGAQ